MTGDAEFLNAARECAHSMQRDFAAGSIVHPILRLPSKEPLPHEGTWSRNPGCYQLKSAMAWHDVAEAGGEPEFEDRYEQALHSALANGPAFLPGAPRPEMVMDRLHAYCYFLEGMLPRAGDADVRLAISTGIERVSAYLRDIASCFERSDVCAQLLRVRLFAAESGIRPLDQAEAEDEAERVASYQRECDDARIDGGFWFGRKGGELLPYVNPVSTAFCGQALAMWSDYRQGRFEAAREELI
jgi:hypothetical protein